jgi:acyl carrier protein
MMMQEANSMERRITAILRDHLAIEVPGPETDLIALGALDSLALVELLVRVERDLGVAVPLEEIDLANFRSIRSIASVLSRKLASG